MDSLSYICMIILYSFWNDTLREKWKKQSDEEVVSKKHNDWEIYANLPTIKIKSDEKYKNVLFKINLIRLSTFKVFFKKKHRCDFIKYYTFYI